MLQNGMTSKKVPNLNLWTSSFRVAMTGSGQCLIIYEIVFLFQTDSIHCIASFSF